MRKDISAVPRVNMRMALVYRLVMLTGANDISSQSHSGEGSGNRYQLLTSRGGIRHVDQEENSHCYPRVQVRQMRRVRHCYSPMSAAKRNRGIAIMRHFCIQTMYVR